MNKLYKAVPVTENPEFGEYFVITNTDGIDTMYFVPPNPEAMEKWNKKVKFYLVPFSVGEELTDGMIDEMVSGFPTETVQQICNKTGHRDGLKAARDHYAPIVAELKEESADYKDLATKWKDDCTDYANKYGAGLRRIAKLEEALKFYADESLYQTPLYDKSDLNNVGMPWPDKGEKARKVLALLSEGGK